MEKSDDLSSKDLRMMRDYLDDLSGVNSRGMPRDEMRGASGPGQEDIFRTVMNTPLSGREEIKFDTQSAWDKVNARISGERS